MVRPEHLADPARTGPRRPGGGRLLLTTRFIFPLHDVPGDYYRFTNYVLAHLFRDWSSACVEAEATTFETMGVLLHRMAIQCEFRAPRLVRLALVIAARLLAKLDWLVVRQYGNAQRTEPVPQMLVSGWHVAASK